MVKNQPEICPNCGETININVIDVDIDFPHYVTHRKKCCKCNTDWYEYFKLTYDGYYLNDKSYDAEGQEEIWCAYEELKTA